MMAEREIPFGRPIIGAEEKAAVERVLEGPMLVHGPKSIEFEEAFQQFTQAPYAVSLASCTAGLHLAYFVQGYGPGDEVIVPAMTHVATAHAVELVGATPVFVDAERETGNIDLEKLEQAITPRTKAISIVHFLGMPVDMLGVCELAKKHGLFVVEDSALAIGTYLDGTHAGLFGDCGCFSFYPVKHLTTAEGGMLITRSPELAEKVKRQKAFGLDRTVAERKVPGVYDVTMLGLNYRMNELEAALGIEQMKRVPLFLRTREENYQTLSRALEKIDGIQQFSSSEGRFKSSYYCLSALLDEKLVPRRYEIVAALKKRGVGTSVYYPQPVPSFTYYRQKYGCREEEYPVARYISEASISLPVGPHLGTDDMTYIAEAFEAALEEVIHG